MKKITMFTLTAILILAVIPLSLAASTVTVATPAKGEISSEIALASDGAARYIAYTDNEGSIHLVTVRSSLGVQDIKVPTVKEGYVEEIALFSDGSIGIGYGLKGSLWIVSTADGITFSTPREVTGPGQSISVVDFAAAEDDTLYATFHRHSSYWDFNFGVSKDKGTSFTWQMDFTRDTDSSSTGYSGQIEYMDRGLYSAYQDNNDGFKVKYRFSGDGGKSWNHAAVPSTLGTLDIAVNGNDPDVVLISVLDTTGSSVYRSTNARSNSPSFSLTYRDDQALFSRSHVRYTDIAFSDDGTAYLVYLDGEDRYILLASPDGGISWQEAQVIGKSVSRTAWWQPDLEVHGNQLSFAFFNEAGNLDLYSTGYAGEGVNLIPDTDGYMFLEEMLSPFSFDIEDDSAVIFSPADSGSYTLSHRTHRDCETLFVVYDLYSDDQREMGKSWSTGAAESEIPSMALEAGGLYLILFTPVESSETGAGLTFAFTRDGEMMDSPVEPLHQIPFDREVTLTWSDNAEQWREYVGERIQVTVPPGGRSATIWGSGVYTDDSIIAVAAVHAGLITFESGGTVIIEIMGPLDSYAGTVRNGVSSNSYGTWHGSYRFITSDGR